MSAVHAFDRRSRKPTWFDVGYGLALENRLWDVLFDDVAALAAAAGMALAGQAMEAWCDDPSVGLDDHRDRAFELWGRLTHATA